MNIVNKPVLVVDFPHVKVVNDPKVGLRTFFAHAEGGYSENMPHRDDAQGRLAVLLLASDAEAGKFILTGEGRVKATDISDLLAGPKQIGNKKLLGNS